jgi:single-stranded DNA-binding protein
MAEISIKSVNKIILVGKVVSDPAYEKTGSGREFCRLFLETDEYVVVKGQNKVISTRHEVVITNQLIVPAFKNALKKGYFISVTGKQIHPNGKPVVEVSDFGHDAQFMYIPSTSQALSSAPVASSPETGGSHAVQGQKKAEQPKKNQSADDFFSPDKPLSRQAPKNTPEGFDDADIPF